jgi:hypothetical protein
VIKSVPKIFRKNGTALSGDLGSWGNLGKTCGKLLVVPKVPKNSKKTGTA